jgi:hypothetical protein
MMNNCSDKDLLGIIRINYLRFTTGVLMVMLSIQQVSAQIIDNRLGNAFSEEMYFNQEFLWQNKIKTITGIVSVKRPNRPIEPRPDLFVFRFNEVGLLREMDKVTSVLQLVDSLKVEYKRNDLGELEWRKESGPRGFSTTSFNYDEHGRVKRLDFGKSENVASQSNHLESGKNVLVNSETYEYSESGDYVMRRKVFNNYGLFYAEDITTRDPLGYIKTEVRELVMSGRTVSREYIYNDRGWISEIVTTDNQGGPERKDVFYYDLLGNLLKVEYYTSDDLIREIEVLYTETSLIEALLDHDLQSRDILIIKFAFEFYQ